MIFATCFASTLSGLSRNQCVTTFQLKDNHRLHAAAPIPREISNPASHQRLLMCIFIVYAGCGPILRPATVCSPINSTNRGKAGSRFSSGTWTVTCPLHQQQQRVRATSGRASVRKPDSTNDTAAAAAAAGFDITQQGRSATALVPRTSRWRWARRRSTAASTAAGGAAEPMTGCHQAARALAYPTTGRSTVACCDKRSN